MIILINNKKKKKSFMGHTAVYIFSNEECDIPPSLQATIPEISSNVGEKYAVFQRLYKLHKTV